MATDPRTPGAGLGRDPDVGDVGAARRRPRRLSTETKVSYKTTELVAYIVVLAAVLIAGLIVDDGDGGDYGARQVWLYATILTVGYMVSRGLAKSGSREPYDEDRTGSSSRQPGQGSGDLRVAAPHPGRVQRWRAATAPLPRRRATNERDARPAAA